jgi:hypothetical protein
MARRFLLYLSVALVVLGLANQARQLPLLQYYTLAPNNHNDLQQRQAIGNATLDESAAPSCPYLKPISWEWNHYSSSRKQNKKKSEKRLLIGLSSGWDPYAGMLEITAPINKAYAKEFSHDVLVLQGTSLVVPKDNCSPPNRRATFNKIALLKEALRHRQDYDQLLILDTDAMMHNMNFDVTSLLADSQMLAAHRVKENDRKHTWDINIGVTVSLVLYLSSSLYSFLSSNSVCEKADFSFDNFSLSLII